MQEIVTSSLWSISAGHCGKPVTGEITLQFNGDCEIDSPKLISFNIEINGNEIQRYGKGKYGKRNIYTVWSNFVPHFHKLTCKEVQQWNLERNKEGKQCCTRGKEVE
jgi:hypothetical protein